MKKGPTKNTDDILGLDLLGTSSTNNQNITFDQLLNTNQTNSTSNDLI